MKKLIKKFAFFSIFKIAYFKLFYTHEKYARKLGVIIGDGCYIAKCSFGSEPFLIEIGSNVQITHGVKFFTHGGGWVFRLSYPDFDCFGKIKIGNNVYIGNDVLLLPGVVVGNNVVIGAGSVITKSIPDNVVVAGNPAKIISSIETYVEKMLPYNVHTKQLSFQEKKRFLHDLDERYFIKKDVLKQ